MKLDMKKFAGQRLVRRIVAMLLGVVILGGGVAVLVVSNMGTDPYSTLNLGVSSKLGLTFGTYQAIFNALLLIAVLISDRSMLGLGTLGNMLLVGFSADLFKPLLAIPFPEPASLSIWTRLLLTVGGVVLVLFGCSLYVTSDLGVSPYDAVSFIVPKKTKIPFRWWRMITDVFCVGVGFLCGASVGVGTLILAFGTGPLLPVFNRYITAPLLKVENIKKD